MKTEERRFSIVMMTYNQGQELEENLPAFLEQEYEPGYEVIVVDEMSTDNTDDVLKLLKQEYSHLYSTFLPKPNRMVMRKKQGFNIGAKAAKYEWIIFTKPIYRPDATDELKTISEAMDNQAELTLGYIGKKGLQLQSFTTCNEASSHILKTERRMKKIRDRRRANYLWGRYNFIIVRKDCVQKVLKYYEEKLSPTKLLGLRLSILWHNLTS